MTAPLRKARPSDAAEIAELSEALGYPASEDEVRQRLDAIGSSSADAVFVAESSTGAVIGWIHVFVARRVESDAFAELGGLVVAETHRGSGVGSALLEAAEEWGRAREVAMLRVRSNVIREAAHGFYQAKGFERLKSQAVFSKRVALGSVAER